MSKELALIENNPVELNKLFGYQGRPKPVIPFLKVNGSEDEDGKTAPKGTFVYDDGGQILYATECTIRSFVKAYQYRLFDGTNKDKNDMSIIFKDFRQELRSMSGKIACGKMNKKSYLDLGDNITATQKYYQDNVKCKLIVFGLVSGNFTNLDTQENVELKDVLFMWLVSQSGYISIDKAINGIEKERRPVPLTEIKLTLKKDKNGAVYFYRPIPEVTNITSSLVVDRDAEYLKRITKFIEDTNIVVNERYTSANRDKQNNSDFATVNSKVNNATPNDEIPF